MNEYAKWSGLAFQMLATMGLAVWGGFQLDKHFGLRFPIFTLSLILLGFGASIYFVYRGVIKDK